MKTSLSLFALSGNEITFQNQHDLQVLYDNRVIDVPAGNTIYFEDAGAYGFHVVENQHYKSTYHQVMVDDRVPDDGTVPTRTIINMQAQITAMRKALSREIDERAGQVRTRFITAIEGQDMVYWEKRREADLWEADNSIDPSRIPHLITEAQVTESTVAEVVARVNAMTAQWSPLSALIEGIRIGAKHQINKAQSVTEIDQAYQDVDWSVVPLS